LTSQIISTAARADWLTAPRAAAWRNILLIITGMIVATWCVMAHTGLDPLGKPLGTDFLSFYAASKLVVSGHAVSAYNVAAHAAAEGSVFQVDSGYAAYFYPPLFLLICAPFALAPYVVALAAWLAITGTAYVFTVRKWGEGHVAWLTILAYPAMFVNAGHGQNAFLSSTLIGLGAYWLDRRPRLAGVAFGLLPFKPHLALLVPVALIATRRWTVLAVAAATLAVFTGVSLLAFGPEAWVGFVRISALARATMEQGFVDHAKMVSAFAGARLVGAPPVVAYLVQGVVIAATLAMLVRARFWRRGRAEAPLLVLGSLLVSPFLLDYDLAMLALPMAWLLRRGLQTGFRPWEKPLLLVGFVLPAIARPLALGLHLPIATVVMLLLMQAIVNRADEAEDTIVQPSAAPAAA